VWRQRPSHWQAQLADALCSSNESGRSLSLVDAMLGSDDECVLQSVIDTLECRGDVYVPDDGARSRLRELRARFVGTPLADQIQTVLARGDNRPWRSSSPWSLVALPAVLGAVSNLEVGDGRRRFLEVV